MGIVCPYCGSKDTIKRVWRKTKFGKKQRYLCKSCGRIDIASGFYAQIGYIVSMTDLQMIILARWA